MPGGKKQDSLIVHYNFHMKKHQPDSASLCVVANGSVRFVGVRTTGVRAFVFLVGFIFPESGTDGSSGSMVSSSGVDALIVMCR